MCSELGNGATSEAGSMFFFMFFFVLTVWVCGNVCCVAAVEDGVFSLGVLKYVVC